MRIALFIGILVFSSAALAQTGYKLDFKINGLKDTTVYLGYYYGESHYIKDTARVNSVGEFSFDGNQTLPQGMYYLAVNSKSNGRNSAALLFEGFVMGSSQRFSMTTNAGDYIKNMVVKGDPDNKLFFENMLFNMERHREAEPFIKVLQDSAATEEQKKEARAAFSKINDKVMAHQEDVMTKNPGFVTARMLKANRAVRVPDPPKRADGSIDSTFQLRWYRQHFFDNFDLADDALIRMSQPLYRDKLYEYLEKLYLPQPDSLTKAIDFIVKKAKPNQETYKYSVWMAMVKYSNPEIMGLDEVYVNLYDKYFATGEMNFWVNDKLKKDLKDQADRYRKSLIGRTGPNLIMQDSKLQRRALYDIKNKYSILFIFDPDCSHCREETPKLVSFYNSKKAKFDFEVFAVSADTSMAKMRDYIKEMKMPWITVNGPRTYVGPYQDLYDAITTPALYILDSRRKIVAKKLPIEKLEEFFINHERMEKAKAARKM